MAKIGRNDPCHCGSGKKYKHCCQDKGSPLLTVDPAWGQDPEWQKIRLTEGEAVNAIMEFGVEQYGDDFLPEALAEFSIWAEYEVDETLLDMIFMQWVAFSWTPEPDDNVIDEQPLGLQYLDAHSDEIDVYQHAFITIACAQPFSFFAVIGVVAGTSLELRDIFLDRTFTVKEATASATLNRGDIIFARVVPFDGQAIIVGLGPTPIPASEHTHLLDIREEIKNEIREEVGLELNFDSLREWDLEMRDIYLSIAEYLANPPRPELLNTDGDPVSFVTLYFDLRASPQEAFDSLRPLALGQSLEHIMEDATLDENGNLLEVSFNWLKKGNKKHESWDNTVMGRLTIDGASLTAAVNSDKRAKKIQSEITKKLGKRAAFVREVHESVDELQEMMAQSGSPASAESLGEEELASRPELQAIVKAQMEAHWEQWYNEPVPALQNKTPLEAARTKAGRERLEALLLHFERENEEISQPFLRVDIEAMRKKLGL